MEECRFHIGDVVQHFKRENVNLETAEYLYRILAFAQHTENGEKLVIYQALYPPYKTCARPYDMFCSEVVVVGAGADAVDYKLISICHKGDIVVSQDYGVAAMALGKNAYAIHQSGKWYTNENIDQMLMERHLNKKARRASGKNHLKGPRKRTAEDDEHFRESFEKMIHMAMDKEN